MKNTIDINKFITPISELSENINNLLQSDFFDNLSIYKKHQIDQRLSTVKFEKIENVYLGKHLHNASPNNKFNYVNLEEDFLINPPKNIPNNSIFLLLNNDIGKFLPQYIEYYNSFPNAFFIIWDWDSQHWLNMSMNLAIYSDFYIPCSSENLSILSQFTPNILGPIFACSFQWKKKFLVDNLNLMLDERSNEPLGKHNLYEKYPRRNRVIFTLNKKFSNVCFSNNEFLKMTNLDNLIEWSTYKSHWIVPVLSGVPIRVYNALITGGIPILPSYYKIMPEIQLLTDTPVYYDIHDVINPVPITELAIRKFESLSESELIGKILSSIELHHLDTRCTQIFNSILNEVEQLRTNDKNHYTGYLSFNKK
jgi:hypothetical protein